ncbi:peptidyl-prolyl cis-trans isomerase FKBP62-like [Acanthaster planci]|uniref:Peptidyl-prolyl cis-trans isomerase FKBP62-like n=1 Tax=Acanthaster planci TaxID=133434 RepID=A0A8B7Y9H3_ACAPL|nr:peptidyl-prolyl cis-trans isomerase FKBP62-like [Acanthaster planci]
MVELEGFSTMSGTENTASLMKSQNVEQLSPCRSFTKRIISPGSGLARPNEGSTCTVQIIQLGGSTQLDEALIGYSLNQETRICLGDGEGAMSHIIDTCVEMMLPGETCRMQVAMEMIQEVIQMRQNNLKIDCKTLLQKPVVFQIELKSLRRDKDIYEMTVTERVDRASKFKSKGSSCFSCGKLQKAEAFYIRALKYLLTVDPLEITDETDATKEVFNTVKSACLLNLAACKLKYKSYEHVVSHCTKALAIDSSNPKGYFRRGIAYMELQDYELAKADFDEAMHLEPTSKPLRQQRQILQERMRSLDAKYAKAMSKMFGGQ